MDESVRPLRYLSLFHDAGGGAPLGMDLDAADLVVMAATSAVMLVAALVLFERRNVHL